MKPGDVRGVADGFAGMVLLNDRRWLRYDELGHIRTVRGSLFGRVQHCNILPILERVFEDG